MKIEINPEYASQVPPLAEEEYNSVRESIKENGQLYPLLVSENGIILDGHHRYRICKELGLEPEYKVVKFNDSLRERLFVLESNLERRHLNPFQRAEIALKTKPILEAIAKKNESLGGKGVKHLTPIGRVDEEVGKRAGVSYGTIRKVEKLIESLPLDQLDKLRKGEWSINQAYKLLVASKKCTEVYAGFRANIQQLMLEVQRLNEEIVNLEKLLTEEKLPEQERKKIGAEYVRKIRESERKITEMQILAVETTSKMMLMMFGDSDEDSPLNAFAKSLEDMRNFASFKESSI